MFEYLNLAMFNGNTNLTTDAGLTPEIKIFWSNRLIDLVEPKLVHSQFAQKHPIPQGSGKTIEFRKWSSLPKMLAPLNEGVTPDGQKMSMSVITAHIDQYGGYVETSDILQLTAIDNINSQAVEQIARQAHRSIDTLDRDVMNAGTNVIYSHGKTARSSLGSSDTLCVDDIKKAVRQLKVMNAEPYDSDYVAIIHPDCTYDLTNDNDWKYPHQYVDTENIYSGEIGRIAGVRFVETTEAKKFVAATNLRILDGSVAAAAKLTVSAYDAATLVITISEELTPKQASFLHGRYVLFGASGSESTPAVIRTAYPGAAGTAKIELISAPATNPASGNKIADGGAGASGRDVYSTLILGANAYGTTEISGGGLEFIAKQLGSAGTADPLNQRATQGWKCTRATKILVDEYMVRVESCSTFNDHIEN